MHCRPGRFVRSRIPDGNQTPDTTGRSLVTVLTELHYFGFFLKTSRCVIKLR
jgi:hypothetical protein